MYLDKANLLSNAQAITVTAPSTDVIDLGANRDISVGEDVELVGVVTESFTAVGAATLDVDIETDDNSGFASAANLIKKAAIPKATLVAGYELRLGRLPPGVERYLRANYTVGTGPMTAGKITLGIVASPRQANRAYPNSSAIS